MGINKTKRNSNLRKWIEKLSFEIIKTGATFIIKMTWMEGSMIYIYRSIIWRMIWHVYITSLTINTRQIWPSLQKKDICVSYWKLPGQEELETDQVFFSEHCSICSNILFHLANMIYTKRDTYYRGANLPLVILGEIVFTPKWTISTKWTISPFKCKTFGSNIKFTISQWLTSSVVPLTNVRFYKRISPKKTAMGAHFFISLTELLFDHFVGSEYWRMLEPISFMTLKYSHICGTQYST